MSPVVKLLHWESNEMFIVSLKSVQVWFGLLLFIGTFSTNRLYRAIIVQCISRRAGEQHDHTIEH